MNALRRFFLFLGLALFSLSSLAYELRLMAWNVYMLPPPIKFSKQKERTRLQITALQSLVGENDVLVLTEAFQSRYKKQILKHLSESYPHHVIQKKKRGFFKFMSSGVMILSKYPFKLLGQIYYEDCAIADCLATKGALLIEVTLPQGSRVQILGTHMQSSNSEKIFRVRKSQIEQIRVLLDEFREAGVPQIVSGDLNVDSQAEVEFNEMLGTLSLEPLAEHMKWVNTLAENMECFGKKYDGSEENLDHILIRKNESSASLSSEVLYPLRAIYASKRECDLSDHHAVQSLLVFGSRDPASVKKKTFQSRLMQRDLSHPH
jgi:endonuclease/exonuclease/phosphatase family metal-dependent hydrolase